MSGHSYPGVEATEGPHGSLADFFTSDCRHGCGCWMGASSSGGPDGVDPFGECPNALGRDDAAVMGVSPTRHAAEFNGPAPGLVEAVRELSLMPLMRAVVAAAVAERERRQRLMAASMAGLDIFALAEFQVWRGAADALNRAVDAYVEAAGS